MRRLVPATVAVLLVTATAHGAAAGPTAAAGARLSVAEQGTATSARPATADAPARATAGDRDRTGPGRRQRQAERPSAAGFGLSATLADHGVHLQWRATGGDRVRVIRDGQVIVELPGSATGFDDTAVAPATTYRYWVAAGQGRHGGERNGPAVAVRTPSYRVGAASADITPSGTVNLGGFGLGDGTVIPQAIVGRGGVGAATDERIRARATVIDDGKTAIAIASIETQGYFAAYQDGAYGLSDMAAQVATDIPGLPAGRILIAADHTHSGPDTIGVWGGSSAAYFSYVKAQTVAAIEQAYRDRSFATVRAGHSDASDLVYNQACTEALNQSPTPTYTGPDVCPAPGKDGMFRVLQATAPNGRVLLTYAAYAAHATAGGGNGLTGDWPQFLSDAMTARYGGTGIAMVGALGGTQPCRPSCSFTRPTNPGYRMTDRKQAIVANYAAHVADALAHASEVTGPVGAQQQFIREAITGPTVTALFTAGQYAGARILRNHNPPWAVGQTVRTVVAALRVGDVAIIGTPGEGFPAIGQTVRDALGASAREVIQLGLANDQLGYLIAPVSYVPIIAAEAPVNDNIIFNVSPTIGEHVACADLRLTLRLGFTGATPASCAPYDAQDATGDPFAGVPVGAVVLPDKPSPPG